LEQEVIEGANGEVNWEGIQVQREGGIGRPSAGKVLFILVVGDDQISVFNPVFVDIAWRKNM
jgi:hypothetical protein